MLKKYQESLHGDGFVSVKRMRYKKVHGYDLMRLSDGLMTPFVVKEENLNPNMEVSCTIGPYLFLQQSLDYVEKEILTMIENEISPIYLDEIGQLELYDKCFHKILKKIMMKNLDVVITVRLDLIEAVREKYQIEEYKIIEV